MKTNFCIFSPALLVCLGLSLASCGDEKSVDLPTDPQNPILSPDISPQPSVKETSTASTPLPTSEILKVQNLSDGDYFFASGQPPNYFGDIFIFRKRDNIVIGFAAESPSDGSCLRQEILSDSQVRTEKATQYSDDEGAVQIDSKISTDDGSFWSSDLSKVDVEQYTNFAEQVQACANMFSN